MGGPVPTGSEPGKTQSLKRKENKLLCRSQPASSAKTRCISVQQVPNAALVSKCPINPSPPSTKSLGQVGTLLHQPCGHQLG